MYIFYDMIRESNGKRKNCDTWERLFRIPT